MGDVLKNPLRSSAAFVTGGASEALYQASPDARKFMDNPVGAVGDFLGSNPEQLDLSAFSPSEQEKAFTTYLLKQAMGQGGPSAAEVLLGRGMDQANANAMGMAAAQRGVSPGLAARLASMQQAANQQQVGQQTSLLRAEEQKASQGLVGQQFASQRGTMAQGQQMQISADQAAQNRRNQLISGLGNAALGFATGGASTVAQGAMGMGSQMAAPQAPAPYTSSYLGGTYAFSDGGKVPGKAKTKGDHPKNDTVPAMLSPGEMVIPRTVVEGGPDAIKKFAQSLLKREGKKNEKAA